MKICQECDTEYVTLVKEDGNRLIHKRIQKDRHEVVPQQEESNG